MINATISITFTPQITSNHRVCWKKTTDSTYNCTTIISGTVGVPVTADISVTLQNSPCESVTFEGYVQPTCEAEASPLNKTNFPNVIYNCGECPCPEGYVYNPGSNFCEQIVITNPTITLNGGIPYSIQSGSLNASFNLSGARLYEDISSKQFPINGYTDATTSFFLVKEDSGSGPTLTYDSSNATNLIFKATSDSTGRLNKCGIWAKYVLTNSPWPDQVWLKVQYCVTVPESKQYIFAMSGDNQIRASIKSNIYNPESQPGSGPWTTNLVNLWGGSSPIGDLPNPIEDATQNPFRWWHMFPLTLPAGTHTFILEGYNFTNNASFGAEVYNLDRAGMLTFMSTSYPANSTDLDPYILFSTKQLKVTPPLTIVREGTPTYSCPSGSGELSECYGVPACVTLNAAPCV